MKEFTTICLGTIGGFSFLVLFCVHYCRFVVWWKNILPTSPFSLKCPMERARCLTRHFMKRRWRGFVWRLSNRLVFQKQNNQNFFPNSVWCTSMVCENRLMAGPDFTNNGISVSLSELQFHYGVFFAYMRLREQEIRNLMWISECVAQNQKSRVHDSVVFIF